MNAIADVIISFKKAAAAATGNTFPLFSFDLVINFVEESGAANKEEASVPSGT